MDNHNNTTDDVKDSFLELEKSLANNAAKKRKKQFLQKVLITIGIAIIVILIIILIIVLRHSKKPDEGKKEEEKEIFNGVIKAKYMINDLKSRGYKYVTLGVEPTELKNKEIYKRYGFTDFIKENYEEYPDGTKVLVEYYRKMLN